MLHIYTIYTYIYIYNINENGKEEMCTTVEQAWRSVVYTASSVHFVLLADQLRYLHLAWRKSVRETVCLP